MEAESFPRVFADEFIPLGQQKCAGEASSGSGHWELTEDDTDGRKLPVEVFIKGKTVTITKGLSNSARTVKMSYTADETVKKAFFCSFLDPDADGARKGTPRSTRGMCIAQESALHFHMSPGDTFSVPLPFPISSAFPVKDGVLLQRKDASVVEIFHLSHPADPLTLVKFIPRASGKSHSIVWTSSSLPLAVLHDSKTGHHSIWLTKEPKEKDGMKDQLSGFLSESSMTSAGTPTLTASSQKGTPSSISQSALLMPLPLRSPTDPGRRQSTGHGDSLLKMLHQKRFRSKGVDTKTSFPFPRNLDTRLTTSPCSALSSRSTVTSEWGSEFMALGELLSSGSGSFSLGMDLVQVWIDGEESEVARRIFLYEDLVGKTYICFLLKRELKLLEFTKHRTELSFHAQNVLEASDANLSKEAKMLLVLDHSGNLCLWSGIHKICQVLFMDSATKSIVDVTRLPSAVQNTFILGTKRKLYRAVIPCIASSTSVDLCLRGLLCVLDPAIASPFLCQWRQLCFSCRRNAPDQCSWQGMDDTVLFQLFCTFLLESFGVKLLEEKKFGRVKEDINLPRYLRCLQQTKAEREEKKIFRVDDSALLHGCIPSVVFALHLLHEEMRLNQLLEERRLLLAETLLVVTTYTKLASYSHYYKELYPFLKNQFISFSSNSGRYDDDHDVSAMPKDYPAAPPQIILWLLDVLDNIQEDSFPFLPCVCETTVNVCVLFSLFSMQNSAPISVLKILKPFGISSAEEVLSEVNALLASFPDNLSMVEKALVFMANRGFNSDLLDCLPRGVSGPLKKVLDCCRERPPNDLPTHGYELLGRDDWATQKQVATIKYRSPSGKHRRYCEVSKNFAVDGMEHLMDDEALSVRFSQDRRIREVRRLLQSSRPARIALEQKPETSDHEFIELQEKQLYLVCQRTMALSVARGMFTLGTAKPIITESLSIPILNLDGRAPPRDNTISLTRVETPPNMTCWPEFHNGVAAGLSVDPNVKEVSSTWIAYNKPADETEMTNEHAGFLLALGLNGHLKKLAVHHLHAYLSKGHDLTSVALLIGLAAAKRGTMDLEVTRILSVHIPALLPAGSTQLDIPSLAQVAALIGLGLVYQSSAHRHITEVLLAEIGRPPGPELEHSTDRESYALAAGLSLGMVTLGKADTAKGLADLKLQDNLKMYLTGGHLLEGEKPVSYKIHEGPDVNVHVTSAPAVVALGLMYLKSNDQVVGSWLDVPDSVFMLESIRPDMLTLMTLCRGLILWDSIIPSSAWIDSNTPSIADEEPKQDSGQLADSKFMSGVRIQVIAGACMAMGIRFAGTANKAAYECLMERTKYFVSLSSSSSFSSDKAGNFAAEFCLECCLLALALVVAGSGNLAVMRLIRQLHPRLQGAEIRYGAHMAVHMALGLLFLGGGRYSISRSNEAIAALMCSLFPIFPSSSRDNRYHMQALRHFYVLACEPRLLLTREVPSLELCYTPMTISYKESSYTSTILAPCIIPPVEDIEEIALSSPRYLPRKLDADKLRECLCSGGTLFVQRRSGCCSYKEDPKGHRSLLMMGGGEHERKTAVLSGASSLSADCPDLLPREKELINRLRIASLGSESERDKRLVRAALEEQMMSAEKRLKEETENSLLEIQFKILIEEKTGINL